jgi:hypothetical protein
MGSATGGVGELFLLTFLPKEKEIGLWNHHDFCGFHDFSNLKKLKDSVANLYEQNFVG